MNELVHVSKWEVMETHFNNATGVPRGVLIVSTNAGYKGTKAEVWRENAQSKKSRWKIHIWDKVAPWLNEDDVKDAKSMNTRSEFVRLFGRPGGGNNWASGKGDAISEEAIDRVFRENLQPLSKAEKGWAYIAGLDLGVSHDHAGLTVVGVNRQERRIRVAQLRDWKPTKPNDKGTLEVDIASVKRVIKLAYDAFRFSWFGYDPAAGGSFLAQEMRSAGVPMSECAFTGASLNEMTVAFMQVLQAGVLECFENEALRRDLGKFNIEVKPLSGYRLRAVSDEYGHADVGTALVICLPRAVQLLGGLESAGFDILVDDGEEMTKEEKESMDPFLAEIVEDQEDLYVDALLKEAAREKHGNNPLLDFF